MLLNVIEFIQAVRDMQLYPEKLKKMGVQSRLAFEENFSIEHIIENWKSLLKIQNESM